MRPEESIRRYKSHDPRLIITELPAPDFDLAATENTNAQPGRPHVSTCISPCMAAMTGSQKAVTLCACIRSTTGATASRGSTAK